MCTLARILKLLMPVVDESDGTTSPRREASYALFLATIWPRLSMKDEEGLAEASPKLLTDGPLRPLVESLMISVQFELEILCL